MAVSDSINGKLKQALHLVQENYFAEESEITATLRSYANELELDDENVKNIATTWVEALRANPGVLTLDVSDFLKEYQLTTAEGVALMCLAEALLRIPDDDTADKLIHDKLSGGQWEAHLGNSQSMYVNAATWGLLITGKLFSSQKDLPDSISTLVKRSGEPMIRAAVKQAMRLIGEQFVLGETIESADDIARRDKEAYEHFSFDMLGEGACTDKDAQRYLKAYLHAVNIISQRYPDASPIDSPGISVKLSALHPRFEDRLQERVEAQLYPRLKSIALACREANIALTIDAEEADRLLLTLVLFERLAFDKDLIGWDGLGLAIQAYQKRALWVVDWIIELATVSKRRLMIRLVKGAYWDYEIKHAQVEGHKNYPVFTQKAATDLNYLVCADKLLKHNDLIYPMFATHNAFTIAAISKIAVDKKYELQRLHGMGKPLYSVAKQYLGSGFSCRVYAPVGTHEHLLAYLVRRMLENGANASFVRLLADPNIPIEDFVQNPETQLQEGVQRIALPEDILPGRKNSRGIALADRLHLESTYQRIKNFFGKSYQAMSLTPIPIPKAIDREVVRNPANRDHVIGETVQLLPTQLRDVFQAARTGFEGWSATPVDKRASILEDVSNKIEQCQEEIVSLIISEAGKTLENAIGEVREAVDFCRYYANEARKIYDTPTAFVGPTGESNTLVWQPRGVVVCISPWNFPLAIFLGQITAALAMGNVVIAKPAEQTSILAYRIVQLLLQAGIPADALQLVLGDGQSVGSLLVRHKSVDAVMFTGSTETAKHIESQLAMRDDVIVPLIAETGGLNAMIADSSTLPEQLTHDVLSSAFDSAGQRCSALRVLYLQEDIFETVIEMLSGAMAELKMGNPNDLTVDIGPVIDDKAYVALAAHVAAWRDQGRVLASTPLPDKLRSQGHFLAPHLIEIDSISQLKREVFGPILHVIKYKAENLLDVVDEINETKYGLTFGIHSRIASQISLLTDKINAGNVYVNRNMIGAVVGVQPFGGRGKSGTGPKAGGPHYLHRLAVEKVVSVNTTAMGGNTELLGKEV